MPAKGKPHSSAKRKGHALEVFSRLRKEYPNSAIALKYRSNLDLLVAVVLSAQCTDKRVNIVTKKLFRKYKTPEDYASAAREELEEDIRSTGFFRNKAKNIRNAARLIISDYGGEVPGTMEELLKLPGVARKTANIVLANGFGVVEGIAVDTHVKRLSGRLGITKNTDPVKIERDLMALAPRKEWYEVSDLLISHGRAVCDARKPKCGDCVLADICPSAKL